MHEIGQDIIATTVVTAEEQIRGRFAVIKQYRSGLPLVRAYRDLQNTLDYFDTIQILSFTEAANTHYEALIGQRIRIGKQDLKIAAITLSIGGTLITRNWKDFQRVPSLPLEDWTTE